MRPVKKGSSPRVYKNYQDAGPDLMDVIGDYCSYCERQIETDLAVEHIQPKSRGGALTDWDNFLLACKNCNSRKGKKPVTLNDYVWPDTDNTMRAIEHVRGGLVQARSQGIPSSVQTKAERLIELVGLDVDPGNPDRRRRPTKRRDRRWKRRQEVWKQAEAKLAELQTLDNSTVRGLIIDIAVAKGLFSIWYAVFHHDRDMRLRLIKAFLGTADDCFDSAGLPIRSPRGCC